MAILTSRPSAAGPYSERDPQRFRDIGYDLTVGAIYVPEDDEQNQGSSLVTTHEIPSMGLLCSSRVKQSMCQLVCVVMRCQKPVCARKASSCLTLELSTPRIAGQSPELLSISVRLRTG